jgi:hypothetical protein
MRRPGAAGTLVVGTGGLARKVARAMADAGAAACVAGGLGSREEADAVFAAAAGGDLRRVVHAYVEPGSLEPRPTLGYDDESWDLHCESSIRSLLFCLQAAHAHLPARGGRIVVVCPTPAPVQAAGRAALAAAASAQRVLAVSAARRWDGRHGRRIAVTAVTVDPAVFAGTVDPPGDLVAALATGGTGLPAGATVSVPPVGAP